MSPPENQNPDESSPTCSLCTGKSRLFFQGFNRSFYICNVCQLVFVPPWEHLTTAQEKKRYLLHNNDPRDKGYQNFLKPVCQQVMLHHKLPASGMDFGSGTGSPLPMMLQSQGFNVKVFDPLFSPDHKLLHKKYDFITCTEVVEHMRTPGQDILTMWNLIKLGGSLYIKTQFRLPEYDFGQWAYMRDLTHVCFYSKKTMYWLATFLSANLLLPGSNITILSKKK